MENPYLVADILPDVFARMRDRNLLYCALVNREWCRIAIPLLWAAPFSTKPRSTTVFNLFMEIVERETGPPAGEKKMPLFDYPSFIKYFDYSNFLKVVITHARTSAAAKENVLPEGRRIIDSILRMLIAHRVTLRTMIVKPVKMRAKDLYSRWARPEYNQLMGSLVQVEIRAFISIDVILTGLARNCKNIRYLDIDFWDTHGLRGENALKSLRKLLENQTGINLFVTAHSGSALPVLETIHSNPVALKNLTLSHMNFEDCQWDWLAECKNLRRLSLMSCLNYDEKQPLEVLRDTHKKVTHNRAGVKFVEDELIIRRIDSKFNSRTLK